MFKANKLLLLFLCLTLCRCTSTNPSLAELDWLEGSWISVDDKNYHEVWVNDNHQLKGLSYHFKQNELVPSEILGISYVSDTLTYVAMVHNQNQGKAVSFPMAHHTKNKWVFENKNHDFPQRITYFKQTGNFMRVIVDGTINNQYQKIEWRLKKIDTAKYE